MLRRSLFILFWLLLPSVTTAQPSHTQKDLNEERVIASLWQQESPEFEALVYQTYNFATDSLPELLKSTPKSKKPAIVVDIDDTLLKSAGYFSSLIGTNDKRTIERSNHWWQNKALPDLPGAKYFLTRANDSGIEIFYISGRFNSVKKAALTNLRALGFPIKSEEQLLFQETDKNTISKESKRASIRNKGYFILMLIGDQLEDLGPAINASLPQKRHWLYNNQNHLGKDWFYIPNLIYGSWETTVNGNLTRPTLEEQRLARIAALNNSYYPELKDPLYAHQSTSAFLWQHASAESDASALQTFNRIDQVTSKIDKTQTSNPAITIALNGSVLEYMPATPGPDDQPDKHYQWFSRLFDDSNLVAGVNETLLNAKNQGYDIFYVADTALSSMGGNNSQEKRQLLAEKLEASGLPHHDEKHILLSSDYCPNEESNCPTEHKTRALSSGLHDGKKYTLVLQIGNLLSDFELPKINNKQDVAGYKELFGRQYFLIPCPLHHDSLFKATGQEQLTTNDHETMARIRRDKAKEASD